MLVNDTQFLDRILVIGGCHIYTGPVKRVAGYGRVSAGRGENGKKHRIPAHVYALLRLGIEIPTGTLVCHKCDVPPCVNPNHLYLGTKSSNAKDFWERQATPEYYERNRLMLVGLWNEETYEQRCLNMSEAAIKRWAS